VTTRVKDKKIKYNLKYFVKKKITMHNLNIILLFMIKKNKNKFPYYYEEQDINLPRIETF
jgi:hypothetical protein